MLINEKLIFTSSGTSRNEVIEEISILLQRNNIAVSSKTAFKDFVKREKEFSTGVGDGIAIPHCHSTNIKETKIIVAKLKNGVEWDSIDGKKVDTVISIVNPKGGENIHLELLSQISAKFGDPDFRSKFSKMNSKEIIEMINNFKVTEKKVDKPKKGTFKVVGVTSCPTGIAHTFMAAEALEKAAKEMKLSVKVETQGTEGSKNVLTKKEIEGADVVILACDRAIDKTRFGGIEVLETSTISVIKDGKSVIKDCLDKKGTKKLPSSSGGSEEVDQSLTFDNFKKRAGQALMGGVSYMLPFVVFGGIMIALAFLIDIQNAGSPDYGTVNEVAYWFKTLGGLSMGMMVPILAAYIAFSMVGKVGLLPGFVVGMIANGQFPGMLADGSWFGENFVPSGFIGAIAGAYLVVVVIILVNDVLKKLPKSLQGIKGILLMPIFTTLISATLFWLMNIPLGYVNYGLMEFLYLLESTPSLSILLGLIIGLMMGSDMGGPINKAAYVFGVATLAEGGATVAMACVMAGGMIPPLAIAFSTTINKRLWTQEERDLGTTNYILGASFITEGAIPFAAKKPKIIIPSLMFGAAIGSMLVAMFQITLGAPHGGIFVLALVQSSLFEDTGTAIGMGVTLYLFSIIVGSLFGAASIYFLTKYFNKKEGIELPVYESNRKFSFPKLGSSNKMVPETEGTKTNGPETKTTKTKVSETKTKDLESKTTKTKGGQIKSANKATLKEKPLEKEV